jgi:hypothetical protein
MRLFEKFPRPWTCQQDESVDAERFGGGFAVFDATGKAVFTGMDRVSHDGEDEFNMNRLQVAELVKLVNEAS